MDGYEILALFMRYVFVLLGTLILLRSFLWLRKDAKIYRKELKNLPDAGLVGEMVDLDTGESFPLPREGTIGTARSCDIRIRDRQAGRRHAAFLFVEGKGLKITPIARQSVYIDGEQIDKGYALHGSRLEIGSTLLRVRLFAGLHVPRRAVYAREEASEEASLEETDFQAAAYPSYDAPFVSNDSDWQEEEDPAFDQAQGEMYPFLETENDSSCSAYDQEDSDMDMTWKYAPIPPEMLAKGENPVNPSYYEENTDANDGDNDEDDDSYTPPFEQPVRRRRHRR